MWSVIGTLLGTLLGVFFGYYFSKKIAATQAQYAERLAIMNARMIASSKLRAAFASAMAEYDLLGEKTTEIDNMLRAALPKHAAAIEEYRCFVDPERQDAYQEAWEEYKEPLNMKEFIFYSEYSGWPEISRELFRERIQAILKFTEPF